MFSASNLLNNILHHRMQQRMMNRNSDFNREKKSNDERQKPAIYSGGPMFDFLMNSKPIETAKDHEPLDYEPSAWKIFIRDLKIMFGKKKPYKTIYYFNYKQRIIEK